MLLKINEANIERRVLLSENESNEKWACRIDKLLPRLIVASLCALILVQTVLFMDGTRQLISKTDKLEGEQIAGQRRKPVKEEEARARVVIEPLQKLKKGRNLSISVLSMHKHPNVLVLINSHPAGNFQDGSVRLTVYENDYLEIDARHWQEAVRFRIEGEADILLPLLGAEFESQGGILAIGRVKLK